MEIVRTVLTIKLISSNKKDVGTLATYLPFWQWDGLQVAGALALSMLAWMLIQGTEPEGKRT